MYNYDQTHNEKSKFGIKELQKQTVMIMNVSYQNKH